MSSGSFVLPWNSPVTASISGLHCLSWRISLHPWSGKACGLPVFAALAVVIAEFGDLRQKLKLADRVKLAHAVKQTVVSITIGMREAKTGQIKHIEYFGELRLHDALRTKPIPFPTTSSDAARSGVKSAS